MELRINGDRLWATLMELKGIGAYDDQVGWAEAGWVTACTTDSSGSDGAGTTGGIGAVTVGAAGSSMRSTRATSRAARRTS